MDILLFNALLVLTCGYALLRGGTPERVAAIMLFSAGMATLALDRAGPLLFQNMEIGVFAIDLLLLVGLVALAIYADRYWTLWITAFHAFAVAVHLARMTNPHLLPVVYAIAATLMSIPMQLGIVWATWRHRKRKSVNGTDNSWSSSSPRWIREQPEAGPRS